MSAEMNSWKTTDLWKEIQNRQGPGSDSVRTCLQECLPEIETILACGTAPLQFTLHDAGHSFRVAQRMTQLIPKDVLPKLSDYELALLLLSAYLHDIGMSPEQGRVSAHYNYLLTGKPDGISKDEAEDFQQWLDDEADGIVPPITKGAPEPQTLRKAGELTACYCRFRHNEWGERWIRLNLRERKMGIYNQWLGDLISLCKSHHEGYSELAAPTFDPRIVGQAGQVVHRRYLAVILRVADVLEFDPERTPQVILRHRDIPSSSAIFWWKDHEISSMIEGNRIVISARPSTATIHRAIEVTIKQIDRELATARALADNTHFEKCPGLMHDLSHKWNMLPSVHSDLRPREDTYEYIDGSFRPDTQKLLQLFSGTQLYGNPLFAVRELLQNAFDAVREQIAYERLSKVNPSDPALERTLGNLHSVTLTVEQSHEGISLICRDDGVGMSKSVIQDRLLVSGASKRHDVLNLERECQKRGFSLGRTGEFGIGVLSYFMLADRVSLRTRRSQETDDLETSGWRFETEGVGAFGELRKDSVGPRGTEVRLHLRPNVVGDDPVRWYGELRAFLDDLLVRVPCRFTLNTEMPGCQELSLQCGWAWTEDQLASYTVNCVQEWDYRSRDEMPLDLLPSSKREELQARVLHRREVLDEFRSKLRFEVEEVQFAGGSGGARIHAPYFDLPGGASLRFLRSHKQGSKYLLEGIGMGHTVEFTMPIRSAWKGMNTSASTTWHKYPRLSHSAGSEAALIEVDWAGRECGSVSVNRNSLALTDTGRGELAALIATAHTLQSRVCASNEHSIYAWLNARVVGMESPAREQINWISQPKLSIKERSWGLLRFPAISALVFAYGSKVERLAKWKGQQVTIAPCLGGPQDDDFYDGEPWHPQSLAPDRILVLMEAGLLSHRHRVAPIWTQCPKPRSKSHVAGMTSRFPPNWNHICGVQFASYSSLQGKVSVWNPRHPLVKLVDAPGRAWCLKVFETVLDPIPHKSELLSDAGRAAYWVLMCLQREQNDLWNGIRDRDAHFLPELWDVLRLPAHKLGHKRSRSIFEFVDDLSDSRLRELSPEGWQILKAGLGASPELTTYLPKVGNSWVLEVEAVADKRPPARPLSATRPRR